jgi:ATP-dependent Zn protease
MTCYFMHLKTIFEKAEVTRTKENRQDVDRVIHSIVGVEYKNCSATWKEVKKRMEDEESFVNMLKSELTKN